MEAPPATPPDRAAADSFFGRSLLGGVLTLLSIVCVALAVEFLSRA